MTTVQKSIDVEVPVRTAYNQWTQFESFPQFMEGVEKIRQISDTRTTWRTKIAGVRRDFEAEITEQHPDERVAWKTVGGSEHSGVVTFHRLDSERSRITLQMEYSPESFTEQAGSALGVLDRRVDGDLERFKEFIERRGRESGEWRGDVSAAAQRPATEERP